MQRKSLAPILALVSVIVLTACSAAIPPSAHPSPSTSPPSVTPEPTQSPALSPEPEPTESPAPDAAIDVPGLGHVTAAIQAIGMPGAGVPVASLAGGDPVRIQMGPVRLGGVAWYMVSGTESEWIGWVPVDVIASDGRPQSTEVVAAFDGDGSGTAATADVEAGAQLIVHVVAAPRVAGEACEIDISVVTTDGEEVQVNGVSEIDAPTNFFQTPLENSSLRVEAAGSGTVEVSTDCTFAGTLTALPA